MAEPVAGIQASILKWARLSQGYSLEDVATHLKRDAADIAAWEDGSAAPTYGQLEKLAYQLYKRPIAVFFLPEPPFEVELNKEFRTLPEVELDHLAPDTRYQIRLAQALQLSLKELNEDTNPAERKIFSDIKLSTSRSAAQQASLVRDYLGPKLADQLSWASSEEALKEWRSAVEAVGVFVFKHSFKQKAISGFCLVDSEFPVIYLNNSAAKTRQIFSLMHELAHVLLHQNSISTLDESHIEELPEAQRRIERFCNTFAAELLVPAADFIERVAFVTGSPTDADIARLARQYHVSWHVILRRFVDKGAVQWREYLGRSREWAEEGDDSGGAGGNYYLTQAAYLGDRYLQLVFSKHFQGKLSVEQVADYLGVKTKSVAGLEALALRKVAPA
jgi:Zn-dependent peptidase ImmA (M78 family)